MQLVAPEIIQSMVDRSLIGKCQTNNEKDMCDDFCHCIVTMVITDKKTGEINVVKDQMLWAYITLSWPPLGDIMLYFVLAACLLAAWASYYHWYDI